MSGARKSEKSVLRGFAVRHATTLLFILVVGFVYYFVPNAKVRFRDVWVGALVAMLIQTDKFGTSIAQALRTHAEVCRTKRRQRAEERSEKVGVKLVFPLVFCLFPALFVVILGPALILITQNL